MPQNRRWPRQVRPAGNQQQQVPATPVDRTQQRADSPTAVTDVAELSATGLRRLLLQVGTAMVAGGQPVHEVEEDLTALARQLGCSEPQIAATPTGITLNLASGEPASFEAVRGPLRLDQSAEVIGIRHELMAGELSPKDAVERLATLRDMPSRFPRWLMNAGGIFVASGIALILQPGVHNLIFAALASVVVIMLMRFASRHQLLVTLLPPAAAFVVAAGVFAAYDADLLLGPLRTLLPPLAVLLPGALMVTGMSELAAGAMVAGASRLIFGSVQLLLFTLGIIAAAKLMVVAPNAFVNVRVVELGWWAAPVGLALIAVGVCLMESAPLSLLPWIAIVLVFSFLAQVLGQSLGGSGGLGSFFGAIAASLGAYLVEAFKPTLPRLVLFLPSFWLLVPGSLGLLSVTQLGLNPSLALPTIFGVAVVICAIVLGLLVGSVLARPIRPMIRRMMHYQGVD